MSRNQRHERCSDLSPYDRVAARRRRQPKVGRDPSPRSCDELRGSRRLRCETFYPSDDARSPGLPFRRPRGVTGAPRGLSDAGTRILRADAAKPERSHRQRGGLRQFRGDAHPRGDRRCSLRPSRRWRPTARRTTTIPGIPSSTGSAYTGAKATWTSCGTTEVSTATTREHERVPRANDVSQFAVDSFLLPSTVKRPVVTTSPSTWNRYEGSYVDPYGIYQEPDSGLGTLAVTLEEPISSSYELVKYPRMELSLNTRQTRVQGTRDQPVIVPRLVRAARSARSGGESSRCSATPRLDRP